MDLTELSAHAWAVRERYAELETRRHGRPWSREEVALGFVGDVGDLMKLVQAAEGVRAIPEARAKLEHELADCLWSVLVLARLYEVDLQGAFQRTMAELEEGLTERLRSAGP